MNTLTPLAAFALLVATSSCKRSEQNDQLELAEDACALLFECAPLAADAQFDDEEDCIDDLAEDLFDNKDSRCGKARNALVECAVDVYSQECQEDFSVLCREHVLVCASPSTNDWACTDEENEVYLRCFE